MKKKDKEQLRTLKHEDLRKELEQLKKKVYEQAVQKSVAPVKNVREGRELRKKIAMILTIMHESELAHE